ncbi:hypothetical protein HanPI659440_Chr09g0323781 [Helianthus annuus]|nr:hypothetical protein HanPI659440_Chr09g0323781 [Helianthus annuus]
MKVHFAKIPLRLSYAQKISYLEISVMSFHFIFLCFFAWYSINVIMYICLYFVGSNQVSVDELIEDIMSLDISRESNASNSVNNPKV